jgi:hypothetical protein
MSLGEQRQRAADRPGKQAPAGEPLVSVVVPCYNHAHFLGEALESVLAQSYGRIEAFVIDDGSADNTRQVTERHPQVHYRRQANRGAAAARNAGIAESEGDFLVFLDADDRLLPWAVKTGMRALGTDAEIACTIGACRDIGPSGEPLGAPDQLLVHEDHYLALLKSCFILSGSSVLFSRWCLEAVGGFDESFPAGDDYDLYLRIARRFPIRCHGRVLTEYRRHACSLTADPVRTLQGELRALQAQRSAVRSRRERAALRSGRRRARQTHGASLRWRLFEQVQQRAWRGALRSTVALARNRPARLIDVLWDLRTARPVKTASPKGETAGQMGALVEITEVSLVDPLPGELHGGFIDKPKPGQALDAKAVDVLGWALGERQRAVAAEFAIDGRTFWRAPLRAQRPDLADAFPDHEEAACAGFRTTLNLIGTPAEFELQIAIVLKGRRRAPLASIRGRHRWRQDRAPATTPS